MVLRGPRDEPMGCDDGQAQPSQTFGPFFARDLLWKDGGTVLFPGRAIASR